MVGKSMKDIKKKKKPRRRRSSTLPTGQTWYNESTVPQTNDQSYYDNNGVLQNAQYHESHDIPPYVDTTGASTTGYYTNLSTTKNQQDVNGTSQAQQEEYNYEADHPSGELTHKVHHPDHGYQKPPQGSRRQSENTTGISFITGWCKLYGLDSDVFVYLEQHNYTTGDSLCGMDVGNMQRCVSHILKCI